MSEEKKKKFVPKAPYRLRDKFLTVPEEIYKASGILFLNKRIKSLIFTTDLAIMANNNAQAIMAVYPFTPLISVTEAIINEAHVPVFAGVGGGTTTGRRSVHIAMMAEQFGAHGVVVNSPMTSEVITELKNVLCIPIIQTVTSIKYDVEEHIKAGVDVLNISAADKTPEVVKYWRERLGDEFPIIATGGPTNDTVKATVDAGANAITWTPPTSPEIFATMMVKYREKENSK